MLSLIWYPPRTNCSEILESTLRNLFPLASHMKANQCMLVVMKALRLNQRMSEWDAVLFWFRNVSANQHFAETNDVLKYVHFATLSKLLPLHFIQVTTMDISGVHSGISFQPQWCYTVFEICVRCKNCAMHILRLQYMMCCWTDMAE